MACISCFAIGAATAPPKPFGTCSTTTAPATFGSLAGAGLFWVPAGVLGVAVGILALP